MRVPKEKVSTQLFTAMADFWDDDDDDDWYTDWLREEREREERGKLAELLPVYQRANDLMELAELLKEAWADEPEGTYGGKLLPHYVGKIHTPIVEAEMDDHYSLRVEWAVCVKQAVFELDDHLRYCKRVHPEGEHYLKLFEPLVEAFRVEFMDWVRSFNRDHDDPEEDEWVLPLGKRI